VKHAAENAAVVVLLSAVELGHGVQRVRDLDDVAEDLAGEVDEQTMGRGRARRRRP
jgi:hypothetical protein